LYGALKGKSHNSGDEYYTRREDILKFLPHFDLSNKTVYCPCDSDKSEFVKYFKEEAHCKELIYTSDDFRTHEDLFEKADIIITNPPFSLKIEFMDIIKKYDKDFIVILPNIFCQQLMPDELNNKIYIYNFVKYFNVPEGNKRLDVNCKWFSSLYKEELLPKHSPTFSGKYTIEVDNNGREYKYFSWKDINNVENNEEFLVPITYDTGWKIIYPKLRILKRAPKTFNKETGKNSFARFVVKFVE
jgi:hypothetical protein